MKSRVAFCGRLDPEKSFLFMEWSEDEAAETGQEPGTAIHGLPCPSEYDVSNQSSSTEESCVDSG